MDNISWRFCALVLVAAYLAVLGIEAGESDGPNEASRGVADSNQDGRQRQVNMWRSSQYAPQSDIVMDELDSEFYRYQNRPVYRPYQPHRLQRPRGSPERPTAGVEDDEYDADANKDLESLPFGVQNVRSVLPVRPTRGRNSAAANAAAAAASAPSPSRVTFQSLCPSRRETVFLNLLQTDYEYRPNHYDEVYCVHPFTAHSSYVPLSNKVCGDVGFNCIQLNRTIFLTRKSPGSGCWESETRLIPAGCECMWPKHHFGDIGGHH